MAGVACAGALLAGCAPRTAVIAGRIVPRPTLYYGDGWSYAIRHEGAWPEPRGPSSGLHGFGGHIGGYACGTELSFDVEHRGQRLDLSGWIFSQAETVGMPSHPMSSRIEVRDQSGRRHSRGQVADATASFGGPPAPLGIDFTLARDALDGQIAGRRFALTAGGDDSLLGTVRFAEGGVQTFALRGVNRLWAMPPADQAALLPFLLTCSRVEAGRAIDADSFDDTLPMVSVDLRQRQPPAP